ncbi:MAG: hypothetical protein KJ638_08795, partial [Chloroflexi bacterium]|nr:hypothetical protein [Chloroflexota bacterium]
MQFYQQDFEQLRFDLPNPDEPEPRITLILPIGHDVTDFLFVFSVQSVTSCPLGKSVVNILVF